jgi:hypothetical protein
MLLARSRRLRAEVDINLPTTPADSVENDPKRGSGALITGLYLGLFWQLTAGLLGHHVFGIPIRPIFIMRAGPLLVLAMRGGGATKCCGKVSRRGERRVVGVHAPGQSRGDLLQEPGVAVGFRIFRMR